MALIVMIFTLFVSTAPAGEGWLVDYEKAKAQAAKEGKDILIDFTGSDWCPPCRALKTRVFDQDEFKAEVHKNFVLLELDYPQRAAQPLKIKEQNAELHTRFAIDMFPTIMLVDAKGQPYAKTGVIESVYQPVGAAKSYLKHLAKLSEQKAARDKALAVKSKGIQRAKQLDAALKSIQTKLGGNGFDTFGSAKNLVLGTYDDVVSEIIKLDAKDKAGLKTSYLASLRALEVSASLEKLLADNPDTKPEVFAGKLGDFIKREKPTGENLQEALFYQAAFMFEAEKKNEAEKLFHEAQKAAPNSDTAKRIDQILKEYFDKKNSL